jgi:mono/diheme cytochrome c family protein
LGQALAAIGCLAGLWFFAPAVPVVWGPSASAATKEAGRALFEHEWAAQDSLARGDGLGPVFNARSCVACHFQGGVGGGGDQTHNVAAFEALPTKERPRVRAGLVHAFAVEPASQETSEILRQLFPIVPGGQRVIEGCTVHVADFNPVRMGSVNTPALFGAGWIDRISDRSITQAQRQKLLANAQREFWLEFDYIPTGRPRVLPGGNVGKFGWKGQFATLAEFVAAACANELGLGNPLMDQAKPLAAPDYPRVQADLSRRQFRELVAFVDTLPRPVQVTPEDPQEQGRAARGESLFHSVGCAICHTPEVGGVEGVYSDFLLHKIDDPEQVGGYRIETIIEVPLPSGHPLPEEWKTPPLWGVADSAPYFHDGTAATLEDAVLRHRGTASRVTEAYQHLSQEERRSIIAFLKTLKAPPDAPQVTSPAAVQLAQHR